MRLGTDSELQCSDQLNRRNDRDAKRLFQDQQVAILGYQKGRVSRRGGGHKQIVLWVPAEFAKNRQRLCPDGFRAEPCQGAFLCANLRFQSNLIKVARPRNQT